jgi:hypothetical protein
VVWYIERNEIIHRRLAFLPYLLSAGTLLLAHVIAAPPAFGSPPAPDNRLEAEGRTYLEQYLQANRSQDEKLRGLKMDVDIEASVPILNRTGRFHALRHVSKLGQITYRAITFQGDNSIKNDVIARYLQAEKESSEKNLDLRRTPDNYKFKYYGEYGAGDWKLHLFELTPKEKRAGLFKGWLWIHSGTGLPVREL